MDSTTPTLHSLPDGFRAIVLGASGSIGGAIFKALGETPRCGSAFAVSRSGEDAFDITQEASVLATARRLAERGPFHLIIDATGVLVLDGVMPEKRLDALDPNHLHKLFAVNSVGRAMVLKHFIPLLAKHERAIFGVLSARVGSIEDNHLGGWYGYRAAKAAGNAFLQTAAIEAARTHPQAVFVALQPGTVASNLSKPFRSASEAISPDESAAGLLQAINRLRAKGRAWFVDHRGEEIPW